MPRDNSDCPAPYDFAGQAIRIEADALARGHGLDPERVYCIMRATATDAYGRPLPPPAPGQDNLLDGLRFHRSLDEAFAYLPPEDALSAFERADPIALSRRAQLVSYLADPTSPSYTICELADLLGAFGRHLERNRDSLVRTGYPRTGFARSPWLDWHLTPLSPTKLPVSAFGPPPDPALPADHVQTSLTLHRTMLHYEEGLLPSDDGGNPVYGHVWSRTARPLPWSKDGPWVVRSFEDPAPVEVCPYEEAPFIEGMPPDVAARLEQGRTTLFQVKHDVVATCARCLRSGEADALWAAVLRILTDALLWSDVQRSLEVEELYWQAGLGDYVVPPYALRPPDEVPGTLSALLSVVGHVEKELRVGTFDRTKSGVEEALAGTDLAAVESYFQAVGHPQQAVLDAALDGFWPLEERERAFWEEFQYRVNAALENDFREEVVVTVRIKRPMAATFEPYLRSFAEWQRTHIEATGAPSPLHLSSPPGAPAVQRSVFRREGEAWTLEFGGHPTRLKDRKGLRYLAHLLARPGEKVHVLDMVRAVEGGPAASGALQRVTERERAEQGLRTAGFGDAGPRLDDEARAQYGQRLRELRERRELAEELGDEAELVRIEGEVEALERQLRAGLDIHGWPRRDASDAERARTNVRNLIEDARKRIAESHPSLAQHLRCVSTGTYCSYDPGPAAPGWEL
ncbi:MAG: hypothetical protein M3Q03_13550 [Chloroflexota bacterium]|nr:hypothetical protein [Chloroflexota bacterium]